MAKTYNIVAVNPGHNGSLALLVDGEVELFIEEERLTRMKYDGNPFRALTYVVERYHIDEFILCGTSNGEDRVVDWTGENMFHAFVRKHNPEVLFRSVGQEHHLGHAAAAFYNSGFDDAVALIVDGAGSLRTLPEFENNPNIKGDPSFFGFETESVFMCDKKMILPVWKSLLSQYGPRRETSSGIIDSAVSITKSYEAITSWLGWHYIEAGKTMGLASYGKNDPNLDMNYFNSANRANKNLFINLAPSGAEIDELRNGGMYRKPNKDWQNDPELCTERMKNFAYAIQRDTQKEVLNLIKSIITNQDLNEVTNNIVISGGYALNCVANYYYVKYLDKSFNVYVEPISSDAGTALGWAKHAWNQSSRYKDLKDVDSEYVWNSKQNNLYYGPKYSNEEIQSVLNENLDMIEITPTTSKEVAQLIADKNIVAIYQGRSEAGPRALGNRSILYDPRDPNGKDIVNTVKHREWFRPFAGSCLVEDTNDWFDMAGMKESPFMMYAVDVAADKIDQIPAITHVDDTCRVQTVSEEQNPKFYELIKDFKEITGVPILFNTSFNLGGDPLVETVEDALYSLKYSKLKYIYFADLGILVKKTIDDYNGDHMSQQDRYLNTIQEKIMWENSRNTPQNLVEDQIEEVKDETMKESE